MNGWTIHNNHRQQHSSVKMPPQNYFQCSYNKLIFHGRLNHSTIRTTDNSSMQTPYSLDWNTRIAMASVRFLITSVIYVQTTSSTCRHQVWNLAVPHPWNSTRGGISSGSGMLSGPSHPVLESFQLYWYWYLKPCGPWQKNIKMRTEPQTNLVGPTKSFS